MAGATEVAKALLDYLQAALAFLLVTKFDRKVTPDLGPWGYEVVARSAAKTSSNGSTLEPEGSSAPAVPAA